MGLREAFEDARGVIAAYQSLGIDEGDCPPSVGVLIGRLDRALLVALKPGARGEAALDETREVERRARELLEAGRRCGERTSVLLTDVRNVLGGHLALE
jgi:hypothetical protein